jgi:DNA-binding Lrp family transcriptional regulator
VVEIAKRLGVHKGNVSKALKKLSRDVTRCVVPAAVEQYEKKTALMESLSFFVSDYMQLYKAGSKGKPPESAAEYAAWLDCQLKLGAESRKVVTAIADISYKMFQAEEVAEILRIMDEEIGLESPECQKRIRDRIERRRAVRFPSIPN